MSWESVGLVKRWPGRFFFQGLAPDINSMFTEYFIKYSGDLIHKLDENLKQRGVVLPNQKRDLNIYKGFFDFLREHLPPKFHLATGKVRSKKHILNRNCDVLIYDKLCPRFLSMTGGYVPVDSLFAFMSIETDLSTESLISHALLTRAMKTLYQSVKDIGDEEMVPIFSVLFSHKSRVPLRSHQIAIKDTSREKGINVNNELDMICILNEGLIIKDWENGGSYKAVETGPDTLLWFYVLLMEYLDREGKMNLRDYIKTAKEYTEY